MAKTDFLTQERLKELMTYDPETGVFRWAYSRPKAPIYSAIGTIDSHGYLVVVIRKKKYYLHRLAYLYMNGIFPNNEIDHINHNRTDNRFCNIQHVSHNENAKNQCLRNTNKSGITGVLLLNKPNGTWLSRIGVHYKTIILYRGKDFFEACCIRKSAEVKYGYHPNHGT